MKSRDDLLKQVLYDAIYSPDTVEIITTKFNKIYDNLNDNLLKGFEINMYHNFEVFGAMKHKDIIIGFHSSDESHWYGHYKTKYSSDGISPYDVLHNIQVAIQKVVSVEENNLDIVTTLMRENV